MAGAALEKLEDQLKCSICLEIYSDPKALQCYHIYCQQCLTDLVVKDQQGQLSLSCPTCHQNTALPPSGVAGLQAAHYLNPLLKVLAEQRKAREVSRGEVQRTKAQGITQGETISQNTKDRVEASGPLEENKALGEKHTDQAITQNKEDQVRSKPSNGHIVLSNQEAVKEKNNDKSTSQSQQGAEANGKGLEFCSVHPDRDSELFCDTCGELICVKCTEEGGKHFEHDYDKVDIAYEKFRQEMMSSLEPMEKQMTKARNALKDFDARSEEITNQEATIESDIQLSVNELHRVLEERQRELLSQLNQITEQKLRDLDAQRKMMEEARAQLSGCLDFVRQNPGEGNQAQVLMRIPPDALEINTGADLAFSIPKDLDDVVLNYGELSTADPADPSKCQVTGKGLETGVVGEVSTILLSAVGFDGKPYEQEIRHIHCELISEITETTTKGSVEQKEESQYEISYQPTVKGRHQLHIKVSGRHIRGSPFSVAVKLPLEMFGTPIKFFGELKSPTSIAVNQRGEVLVAERKGHCVSVFSSSGRKLRSIGSQGTGEGQFSHPCGVTVDLEGNIFVADTDNNRIQKLTADGKFLAMTGGSGSIELMHPRGITYNPTNNRLYLADANDRVLVMNSDLTFHSSFGGKGNGKSEFDHPSDIACDTAGNMYVADSKNNRIQVFTSDLNFLRTIGPECGEGRTSLKSPTSIAVDTSDMVYVTDCNNQISVFSAEGQLVTSFACSRTIGSLCNLAVGPGGVVYVCDSQKPQVTMF